MSIDTPSDAAMKVWREAWDAVWIYRKDDHHVAAAAVIERAIADAVEQERAKAEALAEALRKLRDCDWVISLPDRMDAVRGIARDAIKAWAAREEGEGDEDKRALLGAAVIDRAIAEAVEQERARIVEWLQDTYCSRDVIDLHRLTSAIERGDHKERADG